MEYREIKYDLFQVNEEMVKDGEELYQLAHCISSDLGMFGGIVTGFNERWNMKTVLLSNHWNTVKKFLAMGGYSIPVSVTNTAGKKFTVYNLITKETVCDKPTYQSISQALVDMRDQMNLRNHTKLAIPLLGCGIDGKDWNKVSELIKDVFRSTEVSIIVCRR